MAVLSRVHNVLGLVLGLGSGLGVFCAALWGSVVWCGVAWSGVVVWCGVVWCGVVWCGVVWCEKYTAGSICSYVYISICMLIHIMH